MWRVFAVLFFMAPCFLVLLDEQLIRRALHHARIAISKTPYFTGLDARQFERQIRGEANNHLRHETLLKFSLSFQQWFAVEQVNTYGLPPELEKAILIDAGISAYRQQLKMSLPEIAAKKESA